MKRYWISWYQPTEDYRPLRVPAPDYWCSGFRCSDEAATLCCVLDAESEEDAQRRVLELWPEAEDWRFNQEVEPGWMPNPGRFPKQNSTQSDEGGEEKV